MKLSASHVANLRKSHRKYKDVKAESLPGEDWKTVLNWSAYKVSNFGRLEEDGFIRKPYIRKNAWLVRLWSKDKNWLGSFAAVILNAFVGPPPSPKENIARHLDDDQSNNNLTNLAWGSRADNARDVMRNGKLVFTEERGKIISRAKRGVPATTPPWNKGLKLGPISDELRKKLKKAQRRRWARYRQQRTVL